MLLAGSSVLLRTFIAMEHAISASLPNEVLTMRVPLPPQQYPDAHAANRVLSANCCRACRAVPGVAAVGLEQRRPSAGQHAVVGRRRAGSHRATSRCRYTRSMRTTPTALGHPARGGPAADRERRRRRADRSPLVNERFVRTRLSGRAPLGQMVTSAAAEGPAVQRRRTTRSRSSASCTTR